MASFFPIPSTQDLYIQTPRLELLPINREHASAMFGVLNDSALYEFVGDTPPVDVGVLARRYELWEARRSPDGGELWLNWVLRLRSEDVLIGHLQVGVAPDHADMAWVLGSKWQRHGYATEASMAVHGWLLDFGVQEIRASINCAHQASIRVAERLGLERTTETANGELIWKKKYNAPRDETSLF